MEKKSLKKGDAKVMAWVCIGDGRTLTVRWMVDDNGRPASVNAERYLSMLREDVWPEVRSRAGRRQYWWQQDGATSHTTNAVLDFLDSKFHGRIISRRSDIPWPPYSPDLNPLDFFVWGYVMQQVRRIKPETIDELKAVVEDVVSSIPEEMIRKSVANLRKRCEACLAADGGHFEHFLKSM